VLNKTVGTDNQNKRYWLAGCLTTDGHGRFDFLKIGEFSDVHFASTDPLLCHSRVSLSNAASNYGPSLDGEVRVEVIDASTNDPLEDVLITLTNDRESHSRISNEEGIALIPVSQSGNYSLSTEVNDYVPEHHDITVHCTGDSGEQCVTEIEISVLPKPSNLSLQIALNWGQSSSQLMSGRALSTYSDTQDLDLHLLQIDRHDTRMSCETYYSNLEGCQDTNLNQNVPEGGSQREIITINDIMSQSGKASYMLFVDDNSVSGPNLFTSGARVVITDGETTRIQDISEDQGDAAAGARFWLAGCIEIVGDSFKFVPAKKYSRVSPMEIDKFFCHNLFLNGGVTERDEPFCPNVEMKITLRNSLNNEDILDSDVSVVYEEGINEFAVASGVVPEHGTGVVKVPITKNGHYIIRAEAEGFVPSREEYKVECEMNACGDCRLQLLVALSPSLAPGELRMVLGWADKPKDLDIYVMRRNINSWASHCITYHGHRRGCSEATLDLDNTAGGNNGVETITIHDIPSNRDNVYMIFVQHFGYNRITEEFGRSLAKIKITDGAKISSVELEPATYSQEKHWVAGCLKLTGDSYEFSPINIFLNDRPDDQVPDLCLDTFGMSTTTTTTPAPRTTTTKKPWYRRVFG